VAIFSFKNSLCKKNNMTIGMDRYSEEESLNIVSFAECSINCNKLTILLKGELCFSRTYENTSKLQELLLA